MKDGNFSFEEMWEKIMACDPGYDGLFYTAVKTTGIYCRPSCRSRKPKKINVEFYFSQEEVEQHGFRACKRCQPDAGLSPNTEVVRDVALFLAGNYKRPLLLQEIADHAGLTPSYLDRVFKQETGETPLAYLKKIRVDKAAHLIEHSGLPNLDICFEAGFQSPSNFYKAFRLIKQLSPGEYRKNGVKAGTRRSLT